MDYLKTPLFLERLRKWKADRDEYTLEILITEHITPLYETVINPAIWLPVESREDTLMKAVMRAVRALPRIREDQAASYLLRIIWNERYRATRKAQQENQYTMISVDETFDDSNESVANLEASHLNYDDRDPSKDVIRTIKAMSPAHAEEMERIENGGCQKRRKEFSTVEYFAKTSRPKDQARRILAEIQATIKANLTEDDTVTIKSGDVILKPEHLWQSTDQGQHSNSQKSQCSPKFTLHDVERYFDSLNIQTSFVCTDRIAALSTTKKTASTAKNTHASKARTIGSESSVKSTTRTRKTRSENTTTATRKNTRISFLQLTFMEI